MSKSKKAEKPYDRSTYDEDNYSGQPIMELKLAIEEITEQVNIEEDGLELQHIRGALYCMGFPQLTEEHLEEVLEDMDYYTERVWVWKRAFRTSEELDKMEHTPCRMW